MKNIIKWNLLLFFSILTCFSSYTMAQREQDVHLRQLFLLPDSYQQFRVPSYIKEPEKRARLKQKLVMLSQEFDVNLVVRISNLSATSFQESYQQRDSSRMNFDYFITKLNRSQLLEHLEMKPQADESSGLIASRVYNHGHFSVYQFDQLEDHFYSLFLETDNPQTYSAFLKQFQLAYNEVMGTNYGLQAFEYKGAKETLLGRDFKPAIKSMIYGAIIWLLLLMVWLLSKSKELAVLRMHGYSSLHALCHLCLDRVSLGFLLTNLAVNLWLIKDLSRLNFLWIGLIYLAIALLAWLVIGLLSWLPINSLLGQLKFNHYFLMPVIATKLFGFFICFSLLLPITGLMAVYRGGEHDPSLNNYGVLYPGFPGKDFFAARDGDDIYRGFSLVPLFKYLDRFNLIIFDTSQLARPGFNQEKPFEYRVMVNEYYLHKYPLLTTKGQPIKVDTESPKRIVIVPDTLLPYLKEIRDYYAEKNRNTEVLEQDVEIYVRDSKQAIVDLNHPGRKLAEDVIFLVQKYNDYDLNWWYIGGIGLESRAKIDMTMMTAQDYRDLKNLLKDLAQDDNFAYLLPISKVKEERYKLIIGENVVYLSQIGFAVYLLFGITLLTVLLYTKVYANKIAVKYLHGYSLSHSFAWLYLILAIQALIYVLYIWWNGMAGEFYLALALITLGELAMIGYSIRSIARRRIVDYIQGGENT